MGIGIFAFIIFIIITIVCFIPFAFACFYLLMGVKSLVRTGKDGNGMIRSSALKAIGISILILIGSYLLWRWLISITLSWG